MWSFDEYMDSARERGAGVWFSEVSIAGALGKRGLRILRPGIEARLGESDEEGEDERVDFGI